MKLSEINDIMKEEGRRGDDIELGVGIWEGGERKK